MTDNIFGTSVPTVTNASDGAPGINLGTRIQFGSTGTITGVRWRFPDTLPSGTVSWTVGKYDNSNDAASFGTLGSGTFASPTAGAYNTATASIAVTAGDQIVVWVLTPDRYVASAHYFDSAVVSGSLTAPADDAVTPRRNGRFTSNAASTWPTGGFNASGYHVDVEFTPAGGTTVHGSATVALGSLAVACSGARKTHGAVTVALGGLRAVATMPSAVVTSQTGSWYELLGIYKEANSLVSTYAQQPPTACPNDGQPLVPAGNGALRCPYDGYRWPDAGYKL